MRLAVDTGGTFTDLVLEDDQGRLRMFKAPTTPHDPVEGILNTVAQAAESLSLGLEELLGRGQMFIHGTTHAINAIITGSTAKTALLTTKGHPDVLVLREGGRIEPFNYKVPFPKPYVPKSLTFEIPERIAADGAVLEPLDEAAAIKVMERLKELGVEAVAVCLLWSTVNPSHENRLAEMLAEYLPGVPFTLSHRLNPILREYRRASSTAIDASLKPLMSKYLGGLQSRLSASGFRGRLLMLTSKGGVMDFQELAEAPIHAIGSGPSMAPIAGRHFIQLDAAGDTAIVADTGGTTYDVSLVRRGVIPMTPETWIGDRYRGHIVGFPSVDVKSIGAGGGSIAWVDSGGLLHVGPQSAGAVPGPACYGKGGDKPTVTDASLVLGYLDPNFFLGGLMKLEPALAEEAIKRDVAGPLGLSLEEAALAVMIVATENMVSAIEQITIHQGLDPRSAVLVGAGGAAGLNSVNIAKRLGCTTVLIPEVGAALSAQGALISDLHADYRTLFYTTTDNFNYEGVNAVLESLIGRCQDFIDGPGQGSVESSIELTVEAHYQSQVWEIDVPVEIRRFEGPEDVALVRRAFDRVHQEIFAFNDPGSEVQFICWRAAARCKLASNSGGRLISRDVVRADAPSSRPAYFDKKGWVKTPVAQFGRLKPGQPLDGPAIIESPFTTVVIEPKSRVVRTESGSLLLTADCTLNE